MRNMNRRAFVKYTSFGTAGLAFPSMLEKPSKTRITTEDNCKICIFSKHLQWLDIEDLGKYVKDVGFDGIDLTVRPGGHINPEKATALLPDAVEKISKSGVCVPMIVTNIKDPEHPQTHEVLKAAEQSGIGYYRMGYFRYGDTLSIRKVLNDLHPKAVKLMELNEKYGIHGAYQNHHGNYFVGSSIWDWWYVIKDLDPRWIGFQFDIRHAVAEGGLSWTNDFALVKDFVKCSVVKDFLWIRNEKNRWQPKSVPLGQGMVDFNNYFELYKKSGMSGPISLHFEYPLYQENMTKKQKMDFAMKTMAKDISKLRDYMEDAGLLR